MEQNFGGRGKSRRSLQICVSLFTLTVGIFIHPELVAEPGLDQLGAAYLIAVSTIGITFTLQATCSDSRTVDLGVRIVPAAMSLYILLSFNDVASIAISFGVLAVIAYWFVCRRKIVVAAEPEELKSTRA